MNKPVEPIMLNAPSSKSMSHRAVLAAGLAKGVSRLRNVLESDDLKHTRLCLQALGVEFSVSGQELLVKGIGGKICSGAEKVVRLDVGESGTTCRLLAGIVAAGQGEFEISGRGRMHQRPISSLDKALGPLGVDFFYTGQDGCPPVKIISRGLTGGEIGICLDESSQYLSGVLLGATMAQGPMTINVTGQKIVSWPYVNLTLQIMEEFGSLVRIQVLEHGSWQDVDKDMVTRVEPGRIRFIVHPGTLTARSYQVEGDFSNGSYLLAAGAIGDRPVLVQGLDWDSLQGDKRILGILLEMGAGVEKKDKGILVQKQELRGVDLDMGSCPDLVPTVAVLASLASDSSRITNVAHLKIKESDRLNGVYQEIVRTGCRCRLLDDGLEIDPVPIEPGKRIEFATYDDHRMAMGLSLYELAGVQVILDNPGCVNKSFPGFWDEWEKIRQGQIGLK
ncbi:3-phosphoshikimate 1-carboxyvinyltransferase [Desulfonatronovibrio hydrogenovorans]|uniref:3-phosphoshikimate 1-carboxyvinyltransferase n=1 Tax=Desulfonatronovibrio hydrogenovorans TaxID=53245 RepID=UPI00048ABDC0|nr:3-phosphoshikimate 1-carboxyvinyltransferase [Desulfonatronovibrio hydrogenovorans]